MWSACFAPGFPGVVQAEFTHGGATRSEYVQWFIRPAIDADGAYEIATSAYYLKAPTDRISDIRRGDLIEVNSVAYKASTNPKDDGHGIATIHCEPA